MNAPRPSTPGNEDSDAAKRLAYLEKIAQKCAGSQVVDLDTLKHLAESAQRQPVPPADASSSQGSASDRVDEKFSVEPVHENITRKLPSMRGGPVSTGTLTPRLM
jgi:hypothetical protein